MHENVLSHDVCAKYKGVPHSLVIIAGKVAKPEKNCSISDITGMVNLDSRKQYLKNSYLGKCIISYSFDRINMTINPMLKELKPVMQVRR